MAFIEGQFFSFGENPELKECRYIGYPLEALFFDALQGIPISRRLILSFYSNSVQRKETPPPQIAKYVAGILAAIAEGTVKADYLINPEGFHTKGTTLSPAIVDMVEMSRRDGDRIIPLRDNADGAGAFAIAGERLASYYGVVSGKKMEEYISMGVRPAEDRAPLHEKKIERLYQRQRNREARIKAVQNILDRYYLSTGEPDKRVEFSVHQAWRAELAELYENKRELD